MKIQVSSLLGQATALALFATPLFSPQAQAQEVYSQIVGAIAIDVPGESDLVVAFPFKPSPSFRGPVASVAGSVITVANNALTAGEFASGHFLYIESGALEGRRFDVTANTANSISLGSATLTGLAADDVISVREHATLAEAFPMGVGGIDEIEPGLRQVEVVLPSPTSVGGGLAANRLFYFHDGAWREVGKPLTTEVGDTAIPPGTAFVIRNNRQATVRTYFFGEVVDAPIAVPLSVSADGVTDNFVSVERPLSLTLNELHLHNSGVFTTEDRLLVYPVGAGRIGVQKTPTVYQYTGTQWQVEGATANVGDQDLIKPGSGLAIRKAQSGTAGIWVNTWSLPTND